jgi:hypothetical protein
LYPEPLSIELVIDCCYKKERGDLAKKNRKKRDIVDTCFHASGHILTVTPINRPFPTTWEKATQVIKNIVVALRSLLEVETSFNKLSSMLRLWGWLHSIGPSY